METIFIIINLIHISYCFLLEHRLVCFRFIQHDQHFTCTMRVTLIGPISFPKALKCLHCILHHWRASHELYLILVGIQEMTLFSPCRPDMLLWFRWTLWKLHFPQRAWPTVGLQQILVKWKNDTWTKNVKKEVELWQTNRVCIELWPFSCLQSHLFCHGFPFYGFSHWLLSFESNRSTSFPEPAIHLVIFTE